MRDKHDLIITAAEEVFARFGYKKTTMEDIAAEAQIVKATLYYYFPSKEVIFGEVIRKDSQLFQAKLDDAVSKAHTPEEKIRAYVSARMHHLEDLSKFYPTLTREYLDHFVFVEQMRDDFNSYEKRTLTQLLKEGVEMELFAINDIEYTAHMLTIAIKGLEYPMFMNKKGYKPTDESSRMLDIIFNGINKK
ncbi:MAG: TetR/AcrR family transcriptional regulator [Candidatus Cloacimonetes bacterium]|nr:TetR/AcrR family transcriptional regulator [Candidatus Cloacimonadota bacterium]